MKIIAESAFNHNGNLSYLKKLAHVTKESGADFFTVQVMDAENFCEQEYEKFDIYNNNSFDKNQWQELFDYCKEIDLDLIPCPLEEVSFKMCYDYGFRTIKIHATDIVNVPYLNLIKSKQDCKIILETQCSTFQDIDLALSIIGKQVEVLFHGYSNFPTELEDLNLNVINSFREMFPEKKVGLADHSPTIYEIPIMALGKDYDYLEKHITLTRNNRNFDWQTSIYPEEMGMMVNAINFYKKALGSRYKHPVENEKPFRDIMFKKVIPDRKNLVRSDRGSDYLTNHFNSFNENRVGVALIARLKSKRLKDKVVKPFYNKTLIQDLYDRLNSSKKIESVHLATSNLESDKPLTEFFDHGKFFLGHPISVIDRMLSLAKQEKLGGIFRVTGDNPFTDPDIIDQMVEMMLKDNLDYVRMNNAPFGVSAELFRTSYLWELYLKMNKPHQSEYLTWFVIRDKEARKGCINFIPKDKRTSLVNLSVDYQEDYDRCIKILKGINTSHFCDVDLKSVLDNLDLEDLIDQEKLIKLPDVDSMKLRDYLALLNNVDYKIILDLYEKDLHHR